MTTPLRFAQSQARIAHISGQDADGGPLMPNKPRPENRHREVRVEDELWEAARVACEQLGTTRAAVMRDALRAVVRRAGTTKPPPSREG